MTVSVSMKLSPKQAAAKADELGGEVSSLELCD